MRMREVLLRRHLNEAVRDVWRALNEMHEAGVRLTDEEATLWAQVTAHEGVQEVLKETD